jgi:hypothetical protein
MSRVVQPSAWLLLLRFGVYGILTPLAVATVVAISSDFESNRLFLRSLFLCTLLLTLSLSALWFLTTERRTRATEHSAVRVPDVVFTNALLVLLLAEGFLSMWSHFRPSPIFWGGSVTARIEALRREPGHPYLGGRLNSGGYHDEEFFVSRPEDLVVGVIADSFGLGVVPYDSNFVTLAERRLQAALGDRFRRVAVHNFGIPGIGMDEYAQLLTTEVESTRPDLVVLSVFVGNDIFESSAFGRAPRRFRYVLQQWLVWTVPERLWVIYSERRSRAGELSNLGLTENTDAEGPDLYDDRGNEKPSYSYRTFMSIERSRMRVSDPSDSAVQERFRSFLRALDHFHARLGGRLLVLLIPDEFQVNDELYNELRGSLKGRDTYQRDYPQERIRAYCDEQGIAVLDVLPALRDAERSARTYHLRDTHINVHGNRVVGEALANALLEKVSMAH